MKLLFLLSLINLAIIIVWGLLLYKETLALLLIVNFIGLGIGYIKGK